MPVEGPDSFEFLSDLCDECGDCLVSCPVMHLSRGQAVDEMARLKAGLPSRVLKECTTCMDCNFHCPSACGPGHLVRERWGELARERGLLERARYFLPHSRPNFRTYIIDRMGPEDRSLIRSWESMEPAAEVCYPGCNVIVTPELTRTRALAGLDIRGSLEQCCGEMYFRMGLDDQLSQVARRTTEYFEALGCEKVTILCTAGYYLFTRVLPRYGARFHFEMEPYLALVESRLKSGELEIVRPLDMRVTIQESCYGKQFGPAYLEMPRSILKMLGATVVEQEHRGTCGMCCAIGAGFSPFSSYNTMRMIPYGIRVMRNAKKTGADAVVTYCSGCLQTFSTGMVLYRTGLPVYHLLELVQTAIGETPELRHSRLAWRMFAGVMRHQAPVLLSRRRFTVPDIDSMPAAKGR